MEKYFKVGQLAFDVNHGKGEVISTNKTKDYPISVKFDSFTQSYTIDGKYTKGCNPSLFQTAPIITPNVPIIEFKQGELVLARDFGEWFVRHYSHFQYDEHWCFCHQQTKGTVTAWNEIIKLTDNLILPNK